MTLAKTVCLAVLLVAAAGLPAAAQEKDFNAYPDHVAKYLERLYDEAAQPLVFRPEFPGGFARWQEQARAALRSKIGLEEIAASVGDHKPVVELGVPDDRGGSAARQGSCVSDGPSISA